MHETKRKILAEESNTIPGRSLYSVGYIKLNIQSGRRHPSTNRTVFSPCHLLMFLDFLFRPDGRRKLAGSVKCCSFLIRFNWGGGIGECLKPITIQMYCSHATEKYLFLITFLNTIENHCFIHSQICIRQLCSVLN